MKRTIIYLFLGMVVFLLLGCVVDVPVEDVWGDITAPSVLSEARSEEGYLSIEFDEDVQVDPESLRASNDAQPQVLEPQGRLLVIDTKPGTSPGKSYALSLSARDSAGNSASIVTPFYGHNPRLPRVIISELGTKLSTNFRDFIELLVLEDGDMGGMTVFIGVPRNNDGFFTFPSMEVKAGDFILVHCKAEGIPGEVDETTDKTVSLGKNASSEAWDVWMPESPGLPDASGVVSLAKNPEGPLVDALYYTDKFTIEGKDYRSFGTKKLMERVDTLVAMEGWVPTAMPILAEDGARSEGLTATRTLNRLLTTEDTDTPMDWYVVAQGKASPGKVNNTEVHVIE